jgi:hypothetical protein
MSELEWAYETIKRRDEEIERLKKLKQETVISHLVTRLAELTTEKARALKVVADRITRSNWEGVVRVRKKPIVVHAVQLNFPEGFKVASKEGVLTGKPGDYLMIGVQGEKYPIDKEIFEQTYDVLDKDE